MEKHSWSDITKEDVISAITLFKEYNQSYPEPKSYYLIYDGERYPAKHIRGLAYEIAFGEKISKSDYLGGMETKKFFEKLGFTVEIIDKNDEDLQQDHSWTIISDTIAVKKCDKSFFDRNASVIPITIRSFFGVDDLEEGSKIDISLIFDGESYDALISRQTNDAGARTRVSWSSTGIGKQFEKYKPLENEVYPEAEFEKVDETTYVVTIAYSEHTNINYIGVLDYLINNQEVPYSNPDAPDVSSEEKSRLLGMKERGQKAVAEMKKMAAACKNKYKLDKCYPGSWLDGSNTKTRKYLWTQMKYESYADNPTSISIFVEKNSDHAIFRISLELKNDGADKQTVDRYHSYLDKPIDFSTGLVLVAGSNELGRPIKINDTPESAKAKISAGIYRKVQLSKIIERKPDETNDYYHKELLEAVRLLIPYYEYVLGIHNKEWWPSKEVYDPGITAEQWVGLLTNPKITNDNNLRMFSMMLHYGKPAACSELAAIYGETKNFFNKGSSAYAEKVANSTGCPKPPDRSNEDSRWWPILYVGRKAKKDETGSYIWKLRAELKEALEQIELPEVKEIPVMDRKVEYGLNTILYGPPGTGKTYNTVRIAVSICEPELNVDEMEYVDVLLKYEELKKAGRIDFITFHQSYSYEEFIEGIKPVLGSNSGDSESKDVKYDVIPGVFKRFCDEAKKVTISDVLDSIKKTNPRVWCLMLDGTGDSKLKSHCFKNSEIRIGWPDLPEKITYETDISTDSTRSMLLNFQDEMEIGDIVVIPKVFDRIDAIGIVTGDYEYNLDVFDGRWPRRRTVKWLTTGIDEDIYGINGNTHLGRYTIYPLVRVKADDIVSIANKYGEGVLIEQETKPHVFIIDEINRGNISKIFGELITLIEVTKRAGAEEPLEAILPYSSDSFSVPNNVFILGTMNTADRSIALMDTALRRRFDFVEMMPNPDVIDGITIEADGEILNVAEMLKTVNDRIEYLFDREHTIGHAFFTKLKGSNANINNLAQVFKNNVIPLLQEYFYEDYEKIQLVLGDNDKSDVKYKFIMDDKVDEKKIFKGQPDLDIKEKTYSVNEDAFMHIQSYIEITQKR